jgi:Ca-activated chloride channel family protein
MRRPRVVLFIIAGCVLTTVGAEGQSVRSLVHSGNDQYEEKKFDEAEVSYRKALEQERELVQGHFNLGNALHKQGKYEDAVREFERVTTSAVQPETKAYAHYNIGNSRFEEQQYQEAIASYVESLKLNPGDEDAKHNLSLALKRLQQQQQQQKQQGQDENKKKDQQEQNQDQQQQDQNRDRDQQGEKNMSRADAERILDVLKNSEKEIQKKLKARQAVRPKGEKDW